MRFGDGEIEAFLTIGKAKINLDSRGLVHISGISDETAADSNGAGKSSLGDALSWCLWGETARGVSGDDVVNTALGKGTRVGWDIHDDNGDVYTVVRHRKYPKLKNALQLFHNGTDISKGTTPETQKLVEKMLGCSMSVFNSAVYSGQEAMPDLPSMTDKQLKLLVEEAAGVDVLSRAYETARERARETATKRAEVQINLDRVTDRHTQTRDHMTQQTTSRDSWNANQGQRITNARAHAVTLATEAKVAFDALDPNEEIELRAAITTCETAIAAVASEQVRERDLLSDLTTARSTRQAVESNIAIKKAAEARALSDRDRMAQAVDDTKNGVGKPCNDCGRPLEQGHLAAAIASSEARRDTFNSQYLQTVTDREAAEAKLPQVDRLIAAADKTLTDHRASMTDVSTETARLSALQRELSIVQAKGREVERLKQIAIQANDSFKSIASEQNPYDAMVATLDEELKKWAEQMRLGNEAIVKCAEEEEYAQAVVDVFAPAGVRAHRLDEATPYLNERTAHYLGSLTDGLIEAHWTTLTLSKNGKDLQEKFSIAVEKANSAPSFKNLSGGEKRKVRLACFLALQDLVASRASKSLALFVGDEIDDALDDAGLERLMGVLEEKARDRGTVLVISHNDIGAYCRNTMVVEKKNGISEVRTA